MLKWKRQGLVVDLEPFGNINVLQNIPGVLPIYVTDQILLPRGSAHVHDD